MKHIVNLSIVGFALLAALQILLFGLLALSCNSAVLGFMAGIAIPECIHTLRRMNNDCEED